MKYNFLRFPGGKRKAVTFSYDDGPKYDIRLAEIMNKNGIKGTFNINTDFIGTGDDDWNSTPQEIKKYLLDVGHEIAVHGKHHLAPGLVNPCLGIQDCLFCRLKLEEIFGIIIRGMAYPDSGIRRLTGGNTYENIRQYLTGLGIVYARSLGGDNSDFDLPQDFLAWVPSAHHKNPDIMKMIDAFNEFDEKYSGRREPKLFYLWGHSYEFERENNWDLFENICEKLGNHEDYWYATNIEIYEYVHGYDSLIYSADGRTVYNPNLFDVWFEVDKETFCVKSGETVTFEIQNEL